VQSGSVSALNISHACVSGLASPAVYTWSSPSSHTCLAVLPGALHRRRLAVRKEHAHRQSSPNLSFLLSHRWDGGWSAPLLSCCKGLILFQYHVLKLGWISTFMSKSSQAILVLLSPNALPAGKGLELVRLFFSLLPQRQRWVERQVSLWLARLADNVLISGWTQIWITRPFALSLVAICSLLCAKKDQETFPCALLHAIMWLAAL